MPRLESAFPDVGAALRHFRRNRSFFAVAVLILAFGIGATTAVFSVGETLLLRPLPWPAGERLVTLRSVDAASGRPSTRVAPGTPPRVNPEDLRRPPQRPDDEEPCAAGCGRPAEPGHELCEACMRQVLAEDEEWS